MPNMLSFINLFMTPSVSMLVQAARKQKKEAGKGDLLSFLLVYSTWTVLNLICVKVLTALAEKTAGLLIPVETVKYTVVAALTAFVLPYLFEILRKALRVQLEIK